MRAVRAYKAMNDTLKQFRDSIKHRRSLYRSLQKRGLIQGDPSLRSLDGSMYAQLVNVFQMGLDMISPVELADICEQCHRVCQGVYKDDPNLQAPDRWPEFLDLMAQAADDPEAYGHRFHQGLESGLTDFATELMALEYPNTL